MAKINNISEVFAPGEFLAEELEACGWTQSDLARILARPLQVINQIIKGKKSITPQTAVELAAALGTSPELWLNLETAYRLANTPPANPSIVKRAKLAKAS